MTRRWILAAAMLSALAGCGVTELYVGFLQTDGGTTTTTTTGSTVCTPGMARSCYDGPAGTEGVGLCRAGTQTCAADGASWGACVGEVLPQAEDCATPEDKDCDGHVPACNGALLWAKGWKGAQAPGVAVAAGGDVLITGGFGGTIDFGGGPLTAAGPSAGFVVRLDATGHHLWSALIQGPNVAPTSIAVDASGNVAIVGYFLGVLDAGGGARNALADTDVFVVKLDAMGHHLWSAAFGGILDDAAAAVAFDAAGDVLVTGYFSTTIDFGGSALASAGGHDAFVTKLHGADGSHGWSYRFGDAEDQDGSSIAVDSASDVLLTGGFAGAMDFGGGTLASAGGRDIFVAKLDASGSHVWAKRFGDAADQWGAGIATDAAGGVVVTGALMGQADFGGGTLASAGGRDIFVAKLDASGSHVWAKRFGDVAEQWGASVATDAAGSVVITGALMGQADFGGPEGPIASVGGQDVFAAKLDPSGGYVWAKRFGDTGDQWGAGAAFMGTGSTVISGVFQGTMELGGGVQLTSIGTPGVFVAAFGP